MMSPSQWVENWSRKRLEGLLERREREGRMVRSEDMDGG